MYQSFTDTVIKWFFDNLLMFADSFSVLSIHCVHGLCDATGTGSYAYRDSLDTLLGVIGMLVCRLIDSMRTCVKLKVVRLLLQKSKEQLHAQSNRVRVRLWLNCS